MYESTNIDTRRQRDPLLRGERDDGGDGGRDGLQRAGAAARGALLQEHHRARRRRQPKLRRHELVGGWLVSYGDGIYRVTKKNGKNLQLT